MRQLDDQERHILKALIRNPRASDNSVSKQTKVPVMTVNRKRKKLEQEGILQYYVTIRRGEKGLHIFESRQLYTLKFRAGITEKDYLQTLEQQTQSRVFNAKFVNMSFLGQKDGHLALIFILEAPNAALLSDEFNGHIVPFFRKCFGNDVIQSIETVPLTNTIRLHHNYLPDINMSGGSLQKDWPEEYIFVDDVTFREKDSKLDSFK